MNKIPFIPGVKMHSVAVALSTKQTWLGHYKRNCAISILFFKTVFYDSCVHHSNFFQLCWAAAVNCDSCTRDEGMQQ